MYMLLVSGDVLRYPHLFWRAHSEEMSDLVRDSFFGRLVRLATSGRYFTYPEEREGFELPKAYQLHDLSLQALKAESRDSDAASEEKPRSIASKNDDRPGIGELAHGLVGEHDLEKHIERDVPQDVHRTQSGIITVTWYSDDDPENPHNWSNKKKLWTGFVVLIYTLSIYIAASLYTASIPHMMESWNLGRVASSVGLSIYVLGYGLGPLIMAPLSEVPWIGRNPPYLIGKFFFVILCIPIAFVNNFAGMLVLRFFLGVAGSPALATGGASYGDFSTGMQLPYAIAIWAGGASAGPVSPH